MTEKELSFRTVAGSTITTPQMGKGKHPQGTEIDCEHIRLWQRCRQRCTRSELKENGRAGLGGPPLMTKELCPTDDKRFIQDSASSWTNMNQTCCISAWESGASGPNGNIFPSKFGSWHHQIISHWYQQWRHFLPCLCFRASGQRRGPNQSGHDSLDI